MQSVVIGVDVGNTNTTVACLQGKKVVACDKVPTTEDVTSGIKMAISNVVKKFPKDEEWSVTRLSIGTNYFVNSLVQRSQLVRVSVVRLCGPATRALGPFDDFPEDLRELISSKCYFVNGGYQVDGSVITDVDEKEITEVIKEIKETEVRNVVISGVFSYMKTNQEKQVEQLFARYFPEAKVTLSSDISSNGLLERENAAILNETLKPLCRVIVSGLTQVVNELRLGCPLFFTQNDGSIISSSEALQFPVRTFSCGPANSMLGACHLSGVGDAIVVDTGGTTTTVGSLQGGFPRQSSSHVFVGGVDTNLKMPDILSIGLGGGSVVTYEETGHSVRVQVGPCSFGKSLNETALIFGGSTVTASDIAVGFLKAELGDRSKVRVSPTILEEANEEIQCMIEEAIDLMKTSRQAIPGILVGGGSILKDRSRNMKGITEFILPEFYEVAGAVGAALCQLSGYNGYDDASRAQQSSKSDKVLKTKIQPTATLVKDRPHGEDLTSARASRQYQDIFRQRKSRNTIEPTVPFVDKTTGEWVLSEYDVHCISIGTGILGSGGGGAPKHGLLRALTTLKKGRKIRVVHPKRLKTKSFKDGKVGVAAFMGAPTVGIEKIPGGREIIEAFECIEMILKTDFWGENNKQKLAVKENDNVKYITNFDPKSLEVNETDARGIVALMCPEIGGSNAMETLCAGADMGLPVLDCDGMGRAFPELQMYSPSIYGHPSAPSALVDEKGQREVVLWVKTTKDLEEHLRKALDRMGSERVLTGMNGYFTNNLLESMEPTVMNSMSAAIALRPLTEEVVLETCIMFSITRAYKLGDGVLRAQKENKDPVESICEHEGGVHLITGKISTVCYKTIGGFDRGTIEITGTGKYTDQEMIIDFRNENLIAKRRQAGEEKIVATTPDIITAFDIDTSRAITNDEIKNGMRVAVVALASPPQLRTEAALKVVGPQVFGYDVDFTPIGEYHYHDTIPLPP